MNELIDQLKYLVSDANIKHKAMRDAAKRLNDSENDPDSMVRVTARLDYESSYKAHVRADDELAEYLKATPPQPDCSTCSGE